MVLTSFSSKNLQNNIKFKSYNKNLSLKEFVFKDEMKLKQLILNSFYFFKSFNISGSIIRYTVTVLESNIKLSIIFKNKNLIKNLDLSKINKFLAVKDNNLNEELILKELTSIDLLQDVDNNSNYFLILIKKLSCILEIDFSIKELESSNLILTYRYCN